jgi:hypothetical protein
MSLIEEEGQLRLLRIAHLGQPLEELREEPEQEGGVELGGIDELVRGQDVDHAATLGVGLHEVVEVQGRFPEKGFGALALQFQEAALDGANAGGGDVAVLGLELRGMIAHELQHGPQILEIQQQQAVVIRDLEHHVQHAALGIVQVQEAGEEQRPHVADGGAHGMSLLAVEIPEGDRKAHVLEAFEFQLRDPLSHLGVLASRLAEARQVTLHVGHEDGHADGGEALGQGAQGHGLAGSRGSGHQPVPIGHAGQEDQLGCAYGDDLRLRHGSLTGEGD